MVSEEYCLSPLGMEDGRIKDTQIKATSSLNDTARPKYGRLNETGGFGGWCAERINRTGPFFTQYLQVNLNVLMRIRAIATQGREGGEERVEQYKINYARNWRSRGSWKWLTSESGETKVFKGNIDSQQHTSMLRPPLLADGIRLVPEMYANKLVCMRLELLGCPIKNGLTAYKMPQGNTLEGRYNFTDSIYDGLIKNNFLSSGLGFLTDGSLAVADYDIDNGLGWIGWHSEHTPTPNIIFEFSDIRIFHNVTIHCNVRDSASIQLFSQVEVSFSNDGVTFNGTMSHRPKTIASGIGWKNHNVAIDLCRNTGKAVKFNFSYAGDWILMSEITFNSVPLGSKSLPKVFCAPPVEVPPTPTVLATSRVLASSKTEHLGTTSSPTNGTLVDVEEDGTFVSDSLSGGEIAGIICAVLAVVLIILSLFICWCRFPHLFQRNKAINHFIKVEMKPYGSPRRVNSNVSEFVEKANNARNRYLNGTGVSHAHAEVTACPIYASIGENLGESKPETHVYVNHSHKFHRLGSETKPLKKVKAPVPPAIDLKRSTPEVVYAEPDTPLLLESTPSPTPSSKAPPVPPLNLRVDVGRDNADSDYAEPDTPVGKNHLIVHSPTKPRVVSGYADPVDVITPPPDGTFRNPIYEAVYSQPYYGVSGTSLYSNPNEDLNMRPRQNSFKDFPRNQLIFKDKIGDGQFGEVFIAEALDLDKILSSETKNSKRTTVAVKKLKPDVDKNIKNEFFKEVKAMANLRHINVVRLLGVCQDDPMCMIVEYMANGDLNQFLKHRELDPNRNQSRGDGNNEPCITVQALLYMAKQVASGMKYISSLNFVHRDLATRNCLVGHAYTVKIADFGMSRNLYSKHYYRIEGRVILPIRWMAPECILQGRFTTSSDVWAYGVTLWEILTLAREYPYSDMSDELVISKMQAYFHRPDSAFDALRQPETCPDDLYQLMLRCWRKELDERPSFPEIHSNLAKCVSLSEADV